MVCMLVSIASLTLQSSVKLTTRNKKKKKKIEELKFVPAKLKTSPGWQQYREFIIMAFSREEMVSCNQVTPA